MLFESTAVASSKLGLPVICKQILCFVSSNTEYMGLVTGTRKKFVLKKLCGECGTGLMDATEFDESSAIYGITDQLILGSESEQKLVSNFASMLMDIQQVGLAQAQFSCETEQPLIAKSAPLWLAQAPIKKVRSEIVNDIAVFQEESGLCLTYEYLRIGYFPSITGNLIYKAAGIFELVLHRDQDSVLEKSAETFDPGDISLWALQLYLNKAYFTPHNPLHEIQLVVANLLSNLAPRSEDRNSDALIRLAIYLLWENREGTTNPNHSLCNAHGDSQMKPTLVALR